MLIPFPRSPLTDKSIFDIFLLLASKTDHSFFGQNIVINSILSGYVPHPMNNEYVRNILRRPKP